MKIITYSILMVILSYGCSKKKGQIDHSMKNGQIIRSNQNENLSIEVKRINGDLPQKIQFNFSKLNESPLYDQIEWKINNKIVGNGESLLYEFFSQGNYSIEINLFLNSKIILTEKMDYQVKAVLGTDLSLYETCQ